MTPFYRLSLRWLLIVAGILLFWVALLLDPQSFDPVVSWVAVEPSGTGLPSRASVLDAPKVIASRDLCTPRYSRDITSSSKQRWKPLMATGSKLCGSRSKATQNKRIPATINNHRRDKR